MKQILCWIFDHKKQSWYKPWAKEVVIVCIRCKKELRIIPDGLNTHQEWIK